MLSDLFLFYFTPQTPHTCVTYASTLFFFATFFSVCLKVEEDGQGRSEPFFVKCARVWFVIEGPKKLHILLAFLLFTTKETTAQ